MSDADVRTIQRTPGLDPRQRVVAYARAGRISQEAVAALAALDYFTGELASLDVRAGTLAPRLFDLPGAKVFLFDVLRALVVEAQDLRELYGPMYRDSLADRAMQSLITGATVLHEAVIDLAKTVHQRALQSPGGRRVALPPDLRVMADQLEAATTAVEAAVYRMAAVHPPAHRHVVDPMAGLPYCPSCEAMFTPIRLRVLLAYWSHAHRAPLSRMPPLPTTAPAFLEWLTQVRDKPLRRLYLVVPRLEPHVQETLLWVYQTAIAFGDALYTYTCDLPKDHYALTTQRRLGELLLVRLTTPAP